MADLHFILLILATIEEGGYFANDRKVEEYIAQFNDEYPNYENNKEFLSNVIVNILKSDLKEDSIWFRKSNFFTMIVELCFSKILTEENVSETLTENLLKALNEFERNILENKNENTEKNEFASYYSRMYSGTNNRQSRVIRSNFFKKYVIANVSSL